MELGPSALQTSTVNEGDNASYTVEYSSGRLEEDSEFRS